MNKFTEAMSSMMETAPKEAIKAVFNGLKDQMAEQLTSSATALKELLGSEEVTEEEKEVFVELETNLSATVNSLNKVMDLIINKIDGID